MYCLWRCAARAYALKSLYMGKSKRLRRLLPVARVVYRAATIVCKYIVYDDSRRTSALANF